jgi:hypothetical protein
MSFDYNTHKNVREFMPFMREMIRQVRTDAQTVRLSHYDASTLMSMAGDFSAAGQGGGFLTNRLNKMDLVGGLL